MALTSGGLGKDRESSLAHGSLYRFGQLVLDSRRRTLSRADSPVFLTPKAFDVLLFLAQNPNRLVTKEELLQAVWGDTFVEEGNLTQYISHLRKALGNNSEDARLIVTIARKGYQFTANVSVREAADTPKPAPVQVPTTATLRADARPDHELPIKEAVPKAPGHWRKAAVVGASAAVLLVVVGFVSWRHFAGMTQPRPQRIMLAVLPFENLSGDGNKEYLADGLTEEMISRLGRLSAEQLGVIARTSVMGYKHKNVRLDQVGRDLSVQYVLENSLRASGNHIRLTAQLVQVKDQTHVWSQDYDYPVKEILTVEDEVAKAVAQEIQLRLTSQQQADLAPYPVKAEAFDAYLRGYSYFYRNTAKDKDMAEKYFERATQLDPSYALAWVGLAWVHGWRVNEGLVPTEEGTRLEREAVERALALNSHLALAHAAMGWIKLRDFDWAGANASMQQAIALAPGDPAILERASFRAALLGRLEEALKLGRRAVELDPLNAGSWDALGMTRVFTGQLDEAVADCKKALELRPDDLFSQFWLGTIYALQGRPRDALQEIERVKVAAVRAGMYGTQVGALVTGMYAIAYNELGRDKESDAALRELIAKYHATAAYQIAQVYAFRNHSDEAFEWLDRAYAQRDGGLMLTKADPLLKTLHNDRRYAAFLKKLNLPN